MSWSGRKNDGFYVKENKGGLHDVGLDGVHR
jgi:hypothetical protein